MPELVNIADWVAVAGRWEFENGTARYVGPDPQSKYPYGIALAAERFRKGTIQTEVSFGERPAKSAGRLLFGYSAATQEYYSVGIGGYSYLYALDQYLPNLGWRAVMELGSRDALHPRSQFHIRTRITGQRASLSVNDVPVLDGYLPRPLLGNQAGLFAWGEDTVEFRNTVFSASRPTVFVVMQFGQPYDSLYTEVIKNVVEEMGLEAYRADDVYQPGIILQDVIRGLTESEIIIAEVTPANENVFYEIGFAHALGKTTILLADRGKSLPFDIAGYRVIFYENTIKGKKEVERQLREHLKHILSEG